MLITIPSDMNINEDDLKQLTEKDIKSMIKAAKRMEKSMMQGDIIDQEEKKLKMKKEAKKDVRLQLKLKILELNIMDVNAFREEFGIAESEQKSIVHNRPKNEGPMTLGDVAIIREIERKNEMEPNATKDDHPGDDDDDDDDDPKPTPAPHPLPPVPEAKTEVQTTMVMPQKAEEKPQIKEPVKEAQKIFMKPPRAISPRVQRLYDLIDFHDGTKEDALGRPIVRVRWQKGKAFFDKYQVNYDDRFESFMREEVHERSTSEPIYIPMTFTDIININGKRELLAEPLVAEMLEKKRRFEESAFIIETIPLSQKTLLMTDEPKHARKKITADDSFMIELAKKPEKHGKWRVVPVRVYEDKVHIVPVEQIESFDDAKEGERREYWFGSKAKVVNLTVRSIRGSPVISSDEIDTLTWEIRAGSYFTDRIKNEDVQGVWRAKITGADHRRNITFVLPVCKLKESEDDDLQKESLEQFKKEDELFGKLKGGDKVEVV